MPAYATRLLTVTTTREAQPRATARDFPTTCNAATQSRALTRARAPSSPSPDAAQVAVTTSTALGTWHGVCPPRSVPPLAPGQRCSAASAPAGLITSCAGGRLSRTCATRGQRPPYYETVVLCVPAGATEVPHLRHRMTRNTASSGSGAGIEGELATHQRHPKHLDHLVSPVVKHHNHNQTRVCGAYKEGEPPLLPHLSPRVYQSRQHYALHSSVCSPRHHGSCPRHAAGRPLQ